MDNGSHASGRLADTATESPDVAVPGTRVPALALVRSPLRLGRPSAAMPQDWRDACHRLLAWLELEAELVEAGEAVVMFAPWIPATMVALPANYDLQWAASYLVDHGIGRSPAQRSVDLALMSPVAASRTDADVLERMIDAARAEGRERLAIICEAGQRDAIGRCLAQADAPLPIELLTIESALTRLAERAMAWDAIIVMPELRSAVFAALAEASGVHGPWPMLWFGAGDARRLRHVTSETAGSPHAPLALDASALIHALALTLDHAGHARAAWRLYRGWAQLRDSGVTTAGRCSTAPYVRAPEPDEFLALLTRELAPSRRPVPAWRVLGAVGIGKSGSQSPVLRVVH